MTNLAFLDHYQAEEHRQAAADAAAKCDERFPRRFAEAHLGQLDNPEVADWVAEFLDGPTNSRSLLLLGGTGTGKTHSAYAALRSAVSEPLIARSGVWRATRWAAMTHADLIASMRPRPFTDHDPEAILKRYQDTELLLIDDLGAIKATEYVEEATYRLLNGRYETMRPSILTSNLGIDALKEAIGDRIASRLAEDCVCVVVDGPDRRRSGRADR